MAQLSEEMHLPDVDSKTTLAAEAVAAGGANRP